MTIGQLELETLCLEVGIRVREPPATLFAASRGRAQLDLADRHRGQVGECLDIVRGPVARHDIDGAERPDDLIPEDERNADVCGNAERLNRGHVAITLVGPRVGDDERVGRLHGVVTERHAVHLACARKGLAESARRLVEVAILVDQRDEGGRYAHQPYREPRQAVERRLDLGVQQARLANRGQPSRIIDDRTIGQYGGVSFIRNSIVHRSSVPPGHSGR